MEETRQGDDGAEDAGAARDRHPQIYSKIREAIIFNRLVVGTQIPIKELGQQFGVSETPMREALFSVAHEDLLEYVPNKGFFVKPLSAERFADHYELAFVLAKHSLEFSTRTFSLEGLERPPGFGVDGANSEEASPRALTEFMERVFERIALLSGNAMIVKAIRQFTDHTTFIRQLDFERPDRRREMCRDLAALIDALLEGDHDAAVQNLRDQATKKRRILIDLVKDGNNRGLSAF